MPYLSENNFCFLIIGCRDHSVSPFWSSNPPYFKHCLLARSPPMPSLKVSSTRHCPENLHQNKCQSNGTEPFERFRHIVSVSAYPYQGLSAKVMLFKYIESKSSLTGSFVAFWILCKINPELSMMSWQEMFAKFQRSGGRHYNTETHLYFILFGSLCNSKIKR